MKKVLIALLVSLALVALLTGCEEICAGEKTKAAAKPKDIKIDVPVAADAKVVGTKILSFKAKTGETITITIPIYEVTKEITKEVKHLHQININVKHDPVKVNVGGTIELKVPEEIPLLKPKAKPKAPAKPGARWEIPKDVPRAQLVEMRARRPRSRWVRYRYAFCESPDLSSIVLCYDTKARSKYLNKLFGTLKAFQYEVRSVCQQEYLEGVANREGLVVTLGTYFLHLDGKRYSMNGGFRVLHKRIGGLPYGPPAIGLNYPPQTVP